MGEAQVTLFEPEFNRSIKVQTSDQRITSHAGAILLRELDHQLGLVESLGEQLTDPRNPDKIRYTKMTSTASHTIRRCGWQRGIDPGKKYSSSDSPVNPPSRD